MAVLKVARLGHPVLRGDCRELSVAELRSPDIQRLIDDMVETMHDYDGVGLAAPQVHVALRLAVIEVPSYDERAEDAVPLMVLANPRLSIPDRSEQLGFEGCLSIPGLRGQVPRSKRLRLEAMDREARPYVLEAADFFARVIQHECDHLDGGVYLDRMRDLRTLSFLEEFEKHQLRHAQE